MITSYWEILIGRISNLYYKVADGDQEILLLYVDDLFGTGEGKLIFDSKKETRYKVRVGRPQYHARLLRS